MPTIQFRSPVTKPLLRKGTPKPMPPDPRAYDTFRVTQQFDDVDFYHGDGRKHLATDIGNFTCGDTVVAMAPGTAWPLKDKASQLGAPSDALGVKVDHGSGITTEVWHLNRIDIAGGQKVAAGQPIGIVGDTGLGSVCHAHVEAKRNGVKFDPEPLMFGGFVVVGEEPLTPDFVPLAIGTVQAGNNLRAEPNVTSENFYLTSTRTFAVLGVTQGGAYVVGGVAGKEWVCIKGEKVWYIARPLIAITATSEGQEIVGTGGYTADDMAKAKAEGEKLGRIDTKTKAVTEGKAHLARLEAL